MELRNTRKWLYIMTGLWLITTLALGAWWLYLVLNMAEILEKNQISYKENLFKMLKWEGPFFFILLGLLTFTLVYLFYRDLKKSQAIQSFFASLTHELKTPLTSIRLQSEILKENLDQQDENTNKSLKRLLTGSHELEEEFDKMLQLARLEREGNLNLIPINLFRFIKNLTQNVPYEIKIEVYSECENSDIIADQFALKVILKNLIQNSLKHNISEKKEVSIYISESGSDIILHYSENNQKFKGDEKKLGDLFYKFNSHQGSGIGLYLSKKLMSQMDGRLEFVNDDKLSFKLHFKRQV